MFWSKFLFSNQHNTWGYLYIFDLPLPINTVERLDPSLKKNVCTPKKLRLPIRISNKMNMIA